MTQTATSGVLTASATCQDIPEDVILRNGTPELAPAGSEALDIIRVHLERSGPDFVARFELAGAAGGSSDPARWSVELHGRFELVASSDAEDVTFEILDDGKPMDAEGEIDGNNVTIRATIAGLGDTASLSWQATAQGRSGGPLDDACPGIGDLERTTMVLEP